MPGEVCEAAAKYSFLIYANEIIYGNNEKGTGSERRERK